MQPNSSLQPWVDFGTAVGRHSHGITDLLALLPPIQPCYGYSIQGETVNCSVVCDEPYLLFDPQHTSNLATCGLWATVGPILVESNQPPKTTPFDAVGLNVSSLETAENFGGLLTTSNSQLQTILVSCFDSFYAETRTLTGDIASVPQTYSFTAIFANPLQVEPCFKDLCAPRTLDADLRGIRVYTFIIIQAIITIVTAIVLSVLVSRPFVKRYGQPNLTQVMMMATVDFQIAQCYFAGAVQIAALIYTARNYLPIRWVASPELLDAGLLFTLGTSGLVPTTLTLTVITQKGRQSWYLILLSFAVFALSTGMLAASTNAWHATAFDPAYGVLQSCGEFRASDLTAAWCGSKNNLFTNSGHNVTDISKVVWVMWAHSLLWLIYCVIKKFRTSNRSLPVIAKLGSICQPRLNSIKTLTIGKWEKLLTRGLFVITWSLSLGYQLWLYTVILRHSITNHTWTFGQILPILFWAPCLADFINLQINGVFKGSEYKFPPQLALAAITSSGNTYNRDRDNDSTANIIPLADMHPDDENDRASVVSRGEQQSPVPVQHV